MDVVKNLIKKIFRLIGVNTLKALIFESLLSIFIFSIWWYLTFWLIGWLTGITSNEIAKSSPFALIPSLGGMIVFGWVLVFLTLIHLSMPEVVAEKARNLITEFPKLEAGINELIQTALQNDNATELSAFVKLIKGVKENQNTLAHCKACVERKEQELLAAKKKLGILNS